MKGKTLLLSQRVGFLDEDFKDRNARGKKSGWCKAWIKKSARKVRKLNKVNILDV